jgi:hypothetical protein
MADGEGCKCWATCEGECTCGVDWTPKGVLELREKLTSTLEREKVLEEALQWYALGCANSIKDVHTRACEALSRVKAMREGKQ